MKLCKDCKHYRVVSLDLSRCVRNYEPFIDPVSGEKGLDGFITYCLSERMSHEKNRCGLNARFFEAKPTLLGKLKELINKCKPS